MVMLILPTMSVSSRLRVQHHNSLAYLLIASYDVDRVAGAELGSGHGEVTH
jgi:hypothetical protein